MRPPGFAGRRRIGNSGNVMDEIEPNPRGITRSEVEQAVAEWCQTHPDAPLCKKLEPARP